MRNTMRRRRRHIPAMMVRNPNTDRDRDKSTGSIGGGRHDGRDCEEGCTWVHRGLCDRRDACNRLRDDAAARKIVNPMVKCRFGTVA